MKFREIAGKITRNPVGYLKRGIFKILIGPFLYKTGKRFDGHRYWNDRLKKYGLSLQGSGDEGNSDKENQRLFREAGETLLNLLQENGVCLEKARALDIGIGNGYFAKLLLDNGLHAVYGIDITDVLFAELMKFLQGYEISLKKLDVSTQKIEGSYDVILMLDVIEHIVDDKKFSFAMNNVKSALVAGGTLILTPVSEKSHSYLFYNRQRSRAEILRHFVGWNIVPELVSFRTAKLMILKKPLQSTDHSS